MVVLFFYKKNKMIGCIFLFKIYNKKNNYLKGVFYD